MNLVGMDVSLRENETQNSPNYLKNLCVYSILVVKREHHSTRKLGAHFELIGKSKTEQNLVDYTKTRTFPFYQEHSVKFYDPNDKEVAVAMLELNWKLTPEEESNSKIPPDNSNLSHIEQQIEKPPSDQRNNRFLYDNNNEISELYFLFSRLILLIGPSLVTFKQFISKMISWENKLFSILFILIFLWIVWHGFWFPFLLGLLCLLVSKEIQWQSVLGKTLFPMPEKTIETTASVLDNDHTVFLIEEEYQEKAHHDQAQALTLLKDLGLITSVEISSTPNGMDRFSWNLCLFSVWLNSFYYLIVFFQSIYRWLLLSRNSVFLYLLLLFVISIFIDLEFLVVEILRCLAIFAVLYIAAFLPLCQRFPLFKESYGDIYVLQKVLYFPSMEKVPLSVKDSFLSLFSVVSMFFSKMPYLETRFSHDRKVPVKYKRVSKNEKSLTVVFEKDGSISKLTKKGKVVLFSVDCVDKVTLLSDNSLGLGIKESSVRIFFSDMPFEQMHELLYRIWSHAKISECDKFKEAIENGKLKNCIDILASCGVFSHEMLTLELDSEGTTALMIASNGDRLEVFEWLWKKLIFLSQESYQFSERSRISYHPTSLLSVYCNAQDKRGFTTLHHACNKGSLEIVCRLLRQPGINVSSETKGNTPLHFLAKRKQDLKADYNIALKLLLERGASINAKNAKGKTPLHYAISSENEECVDFLLINGADPSLPTKNGTTAFDLVEKILNLRIKERIQKLESKDHHI